GQLAPIGGQSRFTNMVGGVEKYVFASPCRAVHGWFDLNSVYHVAYLCETNVYVDTGGVLAEISPTSPVLTPPVIIGQGGYGDLNYSDDNYGTARASRTLPGYYNMPPTYSLDNF